MNDITLAILGKKILAATGVTGVVLAWDEERLCYIIHRDAQAAGWSPNERQISLIVAANAVSEPIDLTHRCWYVGRHGVVGVVTPVADLLIHREPEAPKVEPDVPLVPVEPTAPMAAQVLQMLRQKGDVTAVEAIGVLRCRSLSKRITELKKLGHPIETTLHNDHTGQRYARYVLAA